MGEQEDKNAQEALHGGYTAKEVADALISIGPAMQKAWDAAMGDDSLWQLREELYRETPVLGRFRWYRQLRVWNIRRQIKR
jgi:hypothetical protein